MTTLAPASMDDNDGYISVTNQMVRDCRRLMDRSQRVADLEKILTARTGRKRVHSVATLLALFALAVDQSRATEAIIARTAEIADALTPRQREILGLTGSYHPDQLYRLNALIARLELACDENGVVPDKALPFTLNTLATDIITASIPEQIRPTTAFAIDGTDIETWSNSYKAYNRRAAGAPASDPDAGTGHRTPSQGQEELFFGHMAHLATDLPEFGYTGDHVPLIRALVMAPNNEGVTSRAGIDLVDEIRAFTPVEHVIADRGYTYATADKWAAPLSERGIHQTLDLYPKQTGPQPGPANLPGTEFIDGGLFSTGMPDRLHRIKRIPRFQGVAGHLEQVALFDERARYAFRRVSENKDLWYGPAFPGRERVRCRNWPASMGKLELPMTNCEPDKPCSCGARKTVRDFDPPPGPASPVGHLRLGSRLRPAYLRRIDELIPQDPDRQDHPRLHPRHGTRQDDSRPGHHPRDHQHAHDPQQVRHRPRRRQHPRRARGQAAAPQVRRPIQAPTQGPNDD